MFEGKKDDGQNFKIKWLPIHKFANGELRLVQDGLLALIKWMNKNTTHHNLYRNSSVFIGDTYKSITASYIMDCNRYNEGHI